MTEVNQNNKAAYKDSFKSSILYSGVQVFQILIRVLRSKFIAILLGTVGMGITSLLRSTTDLIATTTNLGLKTSGVKSIATARSDGNIIKIEETIAVMRILVFITGIVGMLICALLAPFWSKNSFGNSDYTWSFVGVSLIILTDQINQGEIALLQGMQLRRLLARANIVSQSISLVTTIPLYFVYGIKAIVPVLVLSSVIALCVTEYYVHKANIKRIKVDFQLVKLIGKGMVVLGFYLSLQHLFSQLSVYLVRIYVSHMGGLDQVGLYGAGVTIVNMYLGLVFTAMATDYFPRLACTKNNEELGNAINNQAEIAFLMFAPIVVAFIIFIRPVIILLYSDKFLPIESMLYFSMAGTLIKAMAWSLSYSIIAKASAKAFFYNEAVATIYTFAFNIIGYKYFGLTGFGISIIVAYSCYLIQESFVCNKLFRFTFKKNMWRLFAFLNLFVVSALIIRNFSTDLNNYVIGSVLFAVTTALSLFLLNRKLRFFKKI